MRSSGNGNCIYRGEGSKFRVWEEKDWLLSKYKLVIRLILQQNGNDSKNNLF